MRVGGDHRADEVERQSNRTGLERCQARGESKSVTVELLVDMYLITFERRVHRVTAAAEVDEVQQLQVLLELLLGNVEAVDDLAGRNDCVMSLATGGEEVSEQRLQNREALRYHRPGGTFPQPVLTRHWGRRC